MSLFKVALLQMTACRSGQDANLAKGEAFCRQAGAMGADVALFPEMWNNGYALPDLARPDALEAWRAQAIGQDDGFVVHFKALARELNMAIALTYWKSTASPNSGRVLSRTWSAWRWQTMPLRRRTAIQLPSTRWPSPKMARYLTL